MTGIPGVTPPPEIGVSNFKGWWIGRIQVSGEASAKGGISPEIQDTVFYWPNTGEPTVSEVNVTDLTAVVEGPYPTKAQAVAVANGDPNTTFGLPGSGKKPGVTTSTVNSSNGSLPSIPNPLSALDNFLSELSSPALWLRIGEVLLGIVLLGVGVAKMTNALPIATKIAETVK